MLMMSMFPLFASAGVFEHAMFDSVSLDGDWEMSYRPYAHESVIYPGFSGVKVKDAVPGYWEDMVEAFRAAGMTDEFRINPWHVKQTFPITGWADGTTFPNIYGCFYYRRTVNLERTGAAVLRFEGVRNQVHAWINGRFIAFRAGFSTPFELEIPDGALKKGENEILLAVSNNPNLGYCDYVCGLTTRSTFLSTGGINGKLELRYPVGDIADVYVTTAEDLASFTVHVSGKSSYEYRISDGDTVKAEGSGKGDFTLSTEGYVFWSPENPKRYTLKLVSGGREYSQKFGIRRLAAAGEKFTLNGRPVYLRGVTEHCYFPLTMHLPRDLGYYRMITAKRKELGFNFVRFHTFVPPAEYLEATDELGMLVHIESPNFVTVHEYQAIVDFARRHPSVVIYCAGNEWRIDRLAEVYLRYIADLVHSGTDSLFSPLSAMRGVEYALMEGKDVVVDKPFRHNAERISRLAEFCDMFTSYQLGLVSYSSLNAGSSRDLDDWGDAYCGKPRTSHEICIDGSYVDFSLEKMYPADSPMLKTGMFSGLREQLVRRGLFDRWEVYFRNSCEWMRRIRKHCFEKLRAADRVAGYDFLGDINTHWHTFGYSVGMMDEFYRLKPGETVENVLRYNSAAVLLSDFGGSFTVKSGTSRSVALSISNYDDDAPDATVRLSLEDKSGKRIVFAEKAVGDIVSGRLSRLGSFTVDFPVGDAPAEYILKASFSGGRVKAENQWEIYAFPEASGGTAAENVKIFENIGEAELLKLLGAGERVVLFGAGPFNSLESTFRIGMAGRCSGDLATVVKKDHPALEGMPHAGYCGWQFRWLMEGGRTVQLEAGVPFDPIIDVASSAKFPIRQSPLFEYRVGEGRLLVCSFAFRASDPAAVWLKKRLVEYAASPEFEPEHSITAETLRAVISHPLLSGAKNPNRARNPSDPASDVRAGKFALP